MRSDPPLNHVPVRIKKLSPHAVLPKYQSLDAAATDLHAALGIVREVCEPEGVTKDNCVWSPHGVINMHKPEKWGYVEFVRQW